MKICIVLQRRFSVLGHAIARALREKYGIEEFCGYAYLRSAQEFLRSQKEIDYQPLLVDEDLHLKAEKEKLDLDYIESLEKEYGIPNLWPYIATDRFFMMSSPKRDYSYTPACSHETMLTHLQTRWRAISEMFEQAKPDVLLLPNIGAMANNILYHLAKKKGIQTVVLEHVRFKNRIVIIDNGYNQFPKVNELFDAIQNRNRQSSFKVQAIDFLKEFREKPTAQIWSPTDKISFLGSFFRWLRFFVKYLFIYFKEAQWRDYSRESPINYLRNRISQRLRKWRGFGGIFEKPRENDDFAFFPLHYEPEIATLVLAPFYTNQIALIQNIAKSLPGHFKLYVKEHPGMLYRRDFAYYKELKKIPNVRLIDAEEKAVSLIQKAKLVLTVTGTAGWEAVMLKKPVIIFGSVFYEKLSMVKRVGEIEKLPFLVKEALENYAHNEEELIDFLSALFELSLPLDYEYLWHEASLKEISRNEQFENLIECLAKELKLAKKDKAESGADENIADITDDHAH